MPTAFRQGTHSLILMMASAIPFASLADGLSLDKALNLALNTAPVLTAGQAQIDAARQTAIPADSLPDPQLILGLDNIPTQGSDSFSLDRDFMTMQRIGVQQTFTHPAKLDARAAAAAGRVDLAQAQIRLARLQILRDTALAWIARDTVERQLARIGDLERENRLFLQAVQARFAGGAAAVDLLAPRREAALIAERRDRLASLRQQAIARLKRWVGDAAAQPLDGGVPDWPIDQQSLSHGLHRHPELDLYEPQNRIAEAEVQAAEAEKMPDWALQLAYQRRSEPYSDMVSLQASVDLPIFPEARQQPKLEAKLYQRNALLAEREAALQEHETMLASSLAEFDRLNKAVKRAGEVLLPLAQEKAALALAAWQGNRAELPALVSARRELIEEELNQIALEGERRQLAASLHFTYSQQTLEHAEAQP